MRESNKNSICATHRVHLHTYCKNCLKKIFEVSIVLIDSKGTICIQKFLVNIFVKS